MNKNHVFHREEIIKNWLLRCFKTALHDSLFERRTKHQVVRLKRLLHNEFTKFHFSSLHSPSSLINFLFCFYRTHNDANGGISSCRSSSPAWINPQIFVNFKMVTFFECQIWQNAHPFATWNIKARALSLPTKHHFLFALIKINWKSRKIVNGILDLSS